MANDLAKLAYEFIKARDVRLLLGLHIHGVEVTQAIQHWNSSEHLTDPADRGPDNSVQLVADKPAFVRVYVRNTFSPLPGVVGRVVVQRRRHGLWVDTDVLPKEWPATVTAQPSLPYDQERGRLGSSLNFRIPSEQMTGRMRLRVEVEVPGTSSRADSEVEIFANLLQRLKIRGIPVRYDGPDASGNPTQLAAPTLATFQADAAGALSLFPVSHVADISLAGLFSWNKPLTGNITAKDGKAECPTSWNNLLFWIGVAKAIDGNRADSIYYALLPTGIPLGDAGGCGGEGTVSAAFSGDPMGMAHECGHFLGLDHAPCGLRTGDNGDLNYPAYEPYDSIGAKMASIGEYGLDPDGPTVHSPTTARDFMSYCGSEWVSPYNYRKMLEHPLLDPRWISTPLDELPPYMYQRWPKKFIPDDPRPPWVRDHINQLVTPPEPFVVIIGQIEQDRVEIRSVLRIETRAPHAPVAITDTFFELLDANEAVLAHAPVMQAALNPSGGCGCGGCGGDCGKRGSGLVQAYIPDREGVAAIRIVKEGEEVWRRSSPGDPPQISRLRAQVNEQDLAVSWKARMSEQYSVNRALRWSADGGQSWHALAVLIESDEAVVPVELVQSGSILVQVLLSDGFHTAASEPVQVDVPVRRPVAAILWPRADCTQPATGRVRLWGIGTASDGRALTGEQLQWELDGQFVGTGTEVWVELSDCAESHRATLRAVDGRLSGEASTEFRTVRVSRD